MLKALFLVLVFCLSLTIAGNIQELNHRLRHHIREVVSGVLGGVAARIVAVQVGEGTAMMVAMGAGIAHTNYPW